MDCQENGKKFARFYRRAGGRSIGGVCKDKGGGTWEKFSKKCCFFGAT